MSNNSKLNTVSVKKNLIIIIIMDTYIHAYINISISHGNIIDFFIFFLNYSLKDKKKRQLMFMFIKLFTNKYI